MDHNTLPHIWIIVSIAKNAKQPLKCWARVVLCCAAFCLVLFTFSSGGWSESGNFMFIISLNSVNEDCLRNPHWMKLTNSVSKQTQNVNSSWKVAKPIKFYSNTTHKFARKKPFRYFIFLQFSIFFNCLTNMFKNCQKQCNLSNVLSDLYIDMKSETKKIISDRKWDDEWRRWNS